MKENAIIIEGKRYDLIADSKISDYEACKRCELHAECHNCGGIGEKATLCAIFTHDGYFINTKSMEELNLLLKGRVLYSNGRKVGDVTAVYRDTYWRVDEPYIYYLFIGSERHSFTYSDVDALLRGDRVVYDTGDLLGSVNAYELKCGEGGVR